jgi:aryl-alcohol dehydrogenase-like predicted oxidoreductase
LTGKFSADHVFPKGDHRRRWTREKFPLDLEKVRKIRSLLGPAVSQARAALEFALSPAAISTVIPGAKTADQAQENTEASLHPVLSGAGLEALWRLPAEDELFSRGLIPSWD